ncbi:MAG: hypothetical protein NTY77_19910 [Elusimicrobia bacterium]|nr:hypothetical protein [Elusimicrobiota bacterium]
MTPSILAALFLFAPLAAWSAPGAADPKASPQALARARTQAQTLYTTHEPGQKTLDQAVSVPAPAAGDAQAAQAYGTLKASLASARDVQEGCALPCASPAEILVYREKARLVGSQLGLDAAGLAKVNQRYLPQGKPRLKKAGGAQSAAAQALEAEAVANLLAQQHLSPQMREAMNKRALDLADKLGRSQMIKADAGGVVVLPDGRKARLTPAQLAALNKVPRAQADYLRKLAAAPPVPAELTAQERQKRALAELEADIKANPGRVRQAENYWKSVTDRKAEGFWGHVWKGYSYFNRGLLAVSGLGDVEDSAARTGYASASNDISGWRTAWEATKLAGNSALFAANFIGIGSAGKVAKGAQLLDKPAVIDGLKIVSKEGAEAAATRVKTINGVVETALGGERNYKAATKAMSTYAEEHMGDLFKIERESRWKFWHAGMADWVPEAKKVFYNPFVGEAHEFTHAHQMFTTRAAALEMVAKGKPLAQLTAQEADEAFKLAKSLETAYYAQHEAQALRTAGFLGLTPGKAFPQKLAANSGEILKAFSGAPKWSFSGPQKFYGALSGLGSSQLQIGASVLPVFNVPFIKEGIVSASQSGASFVGGLFPQSADGR